MTFPFRTMLVTYLHIHFTQTHILPYIDKRRDHIGVTIVICFPHLWLLYYENYNVNATLHTHFKLRHSNEYTRTDLAIPLEYFVYM